MFLLASERTAAFPPTGVSLPIMNSTMPTEEIWAFRRRIGCSVYALHLIFNIFGLVGSWFSTLTFCNSHARTAVFNKAPALRYFQTISILEMVNSLLVLEAGVRFMYRYFGQVPSYGWTWFGTHIETPAINTVSLSIDLMIMFLSVERAIACLLPATFRRLNRKFMVWCVIVGSVLASSGLFVPTGFDSFIGKTLQFSSWRFSDPYDRFLQVQEWFLLGIALAVCASAIVACVGSLQASKRRRRLRPPAHPLACSSPISKEGAAPQNDHKRSLSSIDWRLCCLQLTQAVPTAFSYVTFIVRAALFRHFTRKFLLADPATRQGLAWYIYPIAYVDLATGIAHDLSHCFHFYLYFMFCHSFREAFHQLMRRPANVMFKRRPNCGTRAEKP